MVRKKRLAETLVESGLISEVQLQSALQRQLVMGGKIGTNLIELKYVTDEQLEKVLSSIYMMPAAGPDAFLDIHPDTINSIPKEKAVRHRIIPIKKEQRTITVAMENPNDMAVIDELSFITGRRIITVVASEVKIALALEKYYQHPRNLRYIEVMRPMEESVVERTRPMTDHIPAIHVPEIKKEEPRKEEREKEEELGWLGSEELEEYYEPIEIVEAEKSPKKKEVPKHAAPITFQDTVHKLTRVEERDEAIEAVIDYISQHTENVIFFVVSVAEAKALKAKHKGVDFGNIPDLKVTFGGPSVFFTVKNSEEPYYGDISSFPVDDAFLDKVGQNRPLRVYLVPVMVKTKLVSILYLDNSNKDIPSERIGEINSLVEKLSLAFEILILKKKTEGKK